VADAGQGVRRFGVGAGLGGGMDGLWAGLHHHVIPPPMMEGVYNRPGRYFEAINLVSLWNGSITGGKENEEFAIPHTNEILG